MAGRFQTVQWFQFPTGASGSSANNAKLFVPAGGSVQASCGETSDPSQVNFVGMLPPLEKAELEIVNAMAETPAEADAFSVGDIEKNTASAMVSTALNKAPVLDESCSLESRCRSITEELPEFS